MQTVKTYQNIDKQSENVHFALNQMQSIYTGRNAGADVPHRHDYYTVLIIREALGEHKIDFNSYSLGKKQVFFVAPGQVHQLIERTLPNGFVMTFSNQFLIQNAIPIDFVEGLNLFQNYGHSPPLLPNAEQFTQIEGYAREIELLVTQNMPLRDFAIGAYLKLLLIACNNICALNPMETKSNHSWDSLLLRFKQKVNLHYRKEHGTRFYAEQLHVSPDHLNRVVKSKLGKTAKEYIQTRITTEAKRLLYFTTLTQKEIGYELGFSVPANFSAFFKNCMGYSPSQFRKQEATA